MGVINIGYDPEKGITVKTQFEKELNINDSERFIADHFIAVINSRDPSANLSVERRSDNYLSLCSGQYDFLRFKYSDRARWLSIDAIPAGIDENDPLFSAQKNKRQRHWKAIITDLSALSAFDEYVYSAYSKYVDK